MNREFLSLHEGLFSLNHSSSLPMLLPPSILLPTLHLHTPSYGCPSPFPIHLHNSNPTLYSSSPFPVPFHPSFSTTPVPVPFHPSFSTTPFPVPFHPSFVPPFLLLFCVLYTLSSFPIPLTIEKEDDILNRSRVLDPQYTGLFTKEETSVVIRNKCEKRQCTIASQVSFFVVNPVNNCFEGLESNLETMYCNI